MSFNGERCTSKAHLYASSVSLEGVDDGHLCLEKWGAKEGVLVDVEESLSIDVLVRDWDQPFELTFLRSRLALLICVVKKPPAGLQRRTSAASADNRLPGTWRARRLQTRWNYESDGESGEIKDDFGSQRNCRELADRKVDIDMSSMWYCRIRAEFRESLRARLTRRKRTFPALGNVKTRQRLLEVVTISVQTTAATINTDKQQSLLEPNTVLYSKLVVLALIESQ
jgi:hypothetical protein